MVEGMHVIAVGVGGATTTVWLSGYHKPTASDIGSSQQDDNAHLRILVIIISQAKPCH
jgi:hypothetical protein